MEKKHRTHCFHALHLRDISFNIFIRKGGSPLRVVYINMDHNIIITNADFNIKRFHVNSIYVLVLCCSRWLKLLQTSLIKLLHGRDRSSNPSLNSTKIVLADSLRTARI